MPIADTTFPWQITRISKTDDVLSLSRAERWYLHDQYLGVAQDGNAQWLGAPELLERVQLRSWQQIELVDGSLHRLQLCEKIASNRSWVNDSSLTYLQQSRVRLRGQWLGENDERVFLVRNIWPEKWTLSGCVSDANSHLNSNGTPSLALETAQRTVESLRDNSTDYYVRHLWQRSASNAGQNNSSQHKLQYAIGFILNGAQGDDDEAHGGHFSLLLGQLGNDGGIADLVVANYYNPDVYSEKGILPAFTPLDNYLSELNSGQQYYRPSCAVLLTLSEPALLLPLYAALKAQMQAMYQHRFRYDHAKQNCTGISMDGLRAAGLMVPGIGATSIMLAPLMYLKTLIMERDSSRARRVFNYFCEEKTRLLPAQAYVACVDYALNIAREIDVSGSASEARLKGSLMAIEELHFPQIPSSRKQGREPIFSVFDYPERIPKDVGDWQIVPVKERPFPSDLLE